MASVAVLLADGFEEIEAITIIDILRRADILVATAGLHTGEITGAHEIRIMPKTTIDNIISDDFDMIVLPGGQPGTTNLNNDPRVKSLLKKFASQNKLLGAICAAPSVLAEAGLLNGKQATSFPGFLDKFPNLQNTNNDITIDGNIITSKAIGTANVFALAIVERLVSKQVADKLKTSMFY